MKNTEYRATGKIRVGFGGVKTYEYEVIDLTTNKVVATYYTSKKL